MNMDDISRLPASERIEYFNQAAALLGTLSPQLIEKDYWVCWLLRRAFELDGIRSHMTFKGGTSLSKAYGAIHRFSEDVDLAIERSYLGFEGEKAPENAASGKQRKRRCEELQSACQQMVAKHFLPKLREQVAPILYEKSWALEMDTTDPYKQSINFKFPSTALTGKDSYFLPSIKLELGARSDHFPVELRNVHPYLHDAYPNILSDPETEVRVLHIERTYWEKATILHMLAHKPRETPLAIRMSRHYYDLYLLNTHPDSRDAWHKKDLLSRVAANKTMYFSSAMAKYNEARPGSLRLVPDETRVGELELDYAKMKPMFFKERPGLNEILAGLGRLESEINTLP